MKQPYHSLFAKFIIDCQVNALNKAIMRADLRKIEKKLNSGIDLSVKDKRGNTPLHYAIFSNNTEIVKLLLKHQSPLEEKNDLLQTPLMLNCEICSTKNPYYCLIQTPKDDEDKRKQNSFEILQLLVEAGANTQTKDINDSTPLIKATLKENELIVEYLLTSGDIYQQDKKKGTVAAYALECDNYKIIELLLYDMDTNKFNRFIEYIKSIRSIVTQTMMQELISRKSKMDSVKRKHSLENLLLIKPGKTRQIKI